jgi:hypothetical protein
LRSTWLDLSAGTAAIKCFRTVIAGPAAWPTHVFGLKTVN